MDSSHFGPAHIIHFAARLQRPPGLRPPPSLDYATTIIAAAQRRVVTRHPEDEGDERRVKTDGGDVGTHEPLSPAPDGD